MNTDTTLRLVYAKRQMVNNVGEWFTLYTRYTPEEPGKMYEGIAHQISDGIGGEEVFDLGHALVGAEPTEDDVFDEAYADTCFGEVVVAFGEHGVEYHL